MQTAEVTRTAGVKATPWFALCFLLALSCAAPGGAPPATPENQPRLRNIVAEPGTQFTEVRVTTGPELCFDARDNNGNGLIDEGCGIASGVLQFVLGWSEPTADLDLEITDPNGELVEPGRRTASGLTKGRDCPGTDNACHGQNLENVVLDGGPPVRGKYRVRIRLEELGQATPPVRATFGARIGPKTYAAEILLEAREAERVITLEL